MRFLQHIRCEDNNIDKNDWIQDLRESNVMIMMETLEMTETLEQARDREDYWIRRYVSEGASLLNVQGVRSFTYDNFLAAFGKTVEKSGRPPKDVKRKMAVRTEEVKRPRGPRYILLDDAAKATGYAASTLKRKIYEGKIKRHPHKENLLLVSSLKSLKRVAAKETLPELEPAMSR